ncbi:hypothetical protein D621_20675 [beta proteobacterium AAP51]|nr:hypothetical protein D621_20675 [beta proteobacterium AAP51]
MDFLGTRIGNDMTLELRFTPSGWGHDVESKEEVETPPPVKGEKPAKGKAAKSLKLPVAVKKEHGSNHKGKAKPPHVIQCLCARTRSGFKKGSVQSQLPGSHSPLTMEMQLKKVLPNTIDLDDVVGLTKIGDADVKTGMPRMQLGVPNTNTVTGYNTGKARPYCGGAMLAVFKLEGEPTRYDSLAATAFNLYDDEGEYRLHTGSGQPNQVHTEQLLCGQLEAFLEHLEAAGELQATLPAALGNNNNLPLKPGQPEKPEKPGSKPLIGAPQLVKKDSIKPGKEEEEAQASPGLDLSLVTVHAEVTFKHRSTSAVCAACSKTWEDFAKVWAPKLKQLTYAIYP